MHKTVLEKVRMYMKESNERDPDLHDMYIYNGTIATYLL